MISSHHTISERRSAAARANGKKSRGPVTAQGKANSSGNSFRHGLRAKILFDDPESDDRLAAILVSYMDDLKPRSEIERTLVETMAFCHSRRTRLWKLETALLNKEMGQAKSSDDLTPPLAVAFRALSNRCSGLELLNRLEGRFERQFTRAFTEFHKIRASGSLFPASFIAERSQQVTENKAIDPDVNSASTQSDPTEPKPQRSTTPKRQTIVDRPLSLQAAAATQTP